MTSRHWFVAGPYPSPKQIDAALAQFAELLSRDLSLNDIAERMHVTPGSACAFLHMLRQRMGAQAR